MLLSIIKLIPSAQQFHFNPIKGIPANPTNILTKASNTGNWMNAQGAYMVTAGWHHYLYLFVDRAPPNVIHFSTVKCTVTCNELEWEEGIGVYKAQFPKGQLTSPWQHELHDPCMQQEVPPSCGRCRVKGRGGRFQRKQEIFFHVPECPEISKGHSS